MVDLRQRRLGAGLASSAHRTAIEDFMRSPKAAIVAALLVAPAQLSAFTEANAIAPQVLRIEHCRDAGREIARQADLYRGELDARIAFRRGLRAELDRGAARLAEEHRRALAVEDRAVAAAGSLVPLGGDSAHVPHIGWGIFGYFEQRRADTNRAIADAEGTVAAGEAGFHVAGHGWLTGDSLDGAIAADVKARADFDAAVSAGGFAVAYPGIGWIDRNGVEACVAAAETEIASVRATIAAGEYAVAVPGIGWTTRNGLDQMIAAAEAELAALEASLTDGKLSIARQGRGWFDRATLEAWQAANEAAGEDVRRLLGVATYSYPFPSAGWMDGNAIDAAIANRESGIAEVGALQAAGTYTVPSALGWVDGNGARAALALPTCRENGPSPCVPADHRPHYEDVLRRIALAVATDIAIRQLEVDRLRAWRAALDAHATPDFQRLEMEAGRLGVLAAEFSVELAAHRARLGRHIDWLRMSQESIP